MIYCVSSADNLLDLIQRSLTVSLFLTSFVAPFAASSQDSANGRVGRARSLTSEADYRV